MNYFKMVLFMILSAVLSACGSGGGGGGGSGGSAAPAAPVVPATFTYNIQITGNGGSFASTIFTNFGDADQLETDWATSVPAIGPDVTLFGRDIQITLLNNSGQIIFVILKKDSNTVQTVQVNPAQQVTITDNI